MKISGPLRDSVKLFAQAGGLWLERNAFIHAGSLAFYTLFSIAPVVIIAVAIAGTVFGQETARGEIVSRLGNLVAPEAAQAVEEALERWRPRAGGLLPALTGLVAMTVGATTVFAQLQISLNRIWGVATRPRKSSLVILIKNRVVSLVIVITIGFILLVSLVVDVAITSGIASARDWLPLAPWLLSGAELSLVAGDRHRAVRSDFQDASGCRHPVARRLVQRSHNGHSLHFRTPSHQRVSGVPRTRFYLRSRRIADTDPAVGLLLCVDSLLRSGSDQGEGAGFGQERRAPALGHAHQGAARR